MRCTSVPGAVYQDKSLNGVLSESIAQSPNLSKPILAHVRASSSNGNFFIVSLSQSAVRPGLFAHKWEPQEIGFRVFVFWRAAYPRLVIVLVLGSIAECLGAIFTYGNLDSLLRKRLAERGALYDAGEFLRRVDLELI